MQAFVLPLPTVSNETVDGLLQTVDKPGRYIGGEVGSIVKPGPVRARVALCFADVYEVAESHLGLKILYDIINSVPDLAAERVYAVWPDLEAKMRKTQVPLWSLETRRPLHAFDVVGFTLQYELSYATMLAMLEQGGVPMRTVAREEHHPFVIGGGAGAYNPEPIAPFFDALLLGDGEEAIIEIIDVVAKGRAAGQSRAEILESLARVQGLYVPSLIELEHDGGVAVSAIRARAGSPHAINIAKHGTPRVPRRVVADLDTAPYPTRPIVPNVQPVHDRVAVEIQRGCSQSCRFCQAGMITRPTRQRRPETVLRLADEALKNSGADEVGLLSLSAGDYGPINEVLESFFERYRDQRVSVSLPSMRTETMTPELARRVASIRKSGFTFAPEAGSERMRRVINKTNSEEDLLNAVRATVSAGWRLLKFYFIIGLPTETDEDVAAIAHLATRARAAGRKIRGDVDVTVSVSTFVPKPHTAFQWERQIDVAETRAKHALLKGILRPLKIAMRYHSPEQSYLEGVLSRGDRRLADAIELAAQRGCRLDAWTEHYRHDLWMGAIRDALAAHSLAPDDFLAARDESRLLPWDHLDAGILKKFLLRDRKRAYAEATIEDCALTEHCYACGGCDLGDPYLPKSQDGERLVQLRPLVHAAAPIQSQPAATPPESSVTASPATAGAGSFSTVPSPIRTRIRFRYAKVGRAVHLSHLDLMGQILRAVRQAHWPVLFSQGHTPRPRLSFSPACPTAVESHAEFFDTECTGSPDPRALAEQLRPWLPDGAVILDATEVPWDARSINDDIAATTFLVTPGDAATFDQAALLRAVSEFKAQEVRLVRVLRKKVPRLLDARVCVEDVAALGGRLQIVIRAGDRATLKVSEAVAAVLGSGAALVGARVRKESVTLGGRQTDSEAIDERAAAYLGAHANSALDLTHLGLSHSEQHAERTTAIIPANFMRSVPYAE